MQLTQKGKVYALILLTSALFSISVVTFGFFPYFGLSVSFIAFIFLAYYIKKDKTPLAKMFFLIALILSVFLAIRSEGGIILLNLGAIFYFGALTLLSEKESRLDNWIYIFIAPFFLFSKSLFTKNDYNFELKNSLTRKEGAEKVINSLVVTLVTILVLVIIIPLLASVNPFFEKIVSNLIDTLRLRDIKITEKLFEWSLRLAFFFFLVLIVPKLATFVNKKSGLSVLSYPSFNLLVPKIAVALVLSLFFVTQLQLYFSSAQTLQDLGYTYSKYTREVFAQLSFVAVIILGLIYNDQTKQKINRNLTVALAIQGLFLTFMAYKSVYEYSMAWGFTYKRLFGFTIATWILGVFAIYLFTFYRNLGKGIFIVRTLIFSGLVLIAVNALNFDYLIYHFRKASTGQGVDHKYLTRLSSDSLSYKNQLYEITQISSETLSESEKNQAASYGLWMLLYKIERLQEKYDKLEVRGFYLLEYLQYRQIKDIDTQIVRNKYGLPFR